MEIYKENEETKKSWALKLERDYNNDVDLNAVDSTTGECITNLITFCPDGRVLPIVEAKNSLEYNGYDPHEHGNKFDSSGRLIIE